MKPEEFCMYCDWGQNGFNDCTSPEPRERYVQRGWCGWSNIDGISVITERYSITIGGISVLRSDTEKLQKVIAEEKTKQDTSKIRTPQESALKKAIQSLSIKKESQSLSI